MGLPQHGSSNWYRFGRLPSAQKGFSLTIKLSDISPEVVAGRHFSRGMVGESETTRSWQLSSEKTTMLPSLELTEATEAAAPARQRTDTMPNDGITVCIRMAPRPATNE